MQRSVCCEPMPVARLVRPEPIQLVTRLGLARTHLFVARWSRPSYHMPFRAHRPAVCTALTHGFAEPHHRCRRPPDITPKRAWGWGTIARVAGEQELT